ncbi:MAG: hydrolase 2, exosortase A system-associated [Rhodocyclaceae bacterium]|nr:hydrolase 2, exosortase A system-associated [Rhodocyclaceae bacterium]
MASVTSAFHLPTPRGMCFCVARGPGDRARPKGAIVHVPAFAEEMNKSRRMVALQCEALALRGWLVVQFDAGGCGDSEGDFADASWEAWLDDVRLVHRWAAGQVDGPVWLWGLRAGALLACEAASRFAMDGPILLWQPVSSGRQHLQQFLRLVTMAKVVGKSGEASRESPQSRLAAGENVEVAGYVLSPSLADGLASATLDVPADAPRVLWLQVAAPDVPPPRALGELRERLGERTPVLEYRAVAGPAFWQVQEIEEAPELLAATTALVEETAAAELASA